MLHQFLILRGLESNESWHTNPVRFRLPHFFVEVIAHLFVDCHLLTLYLVQSLIVSPPLILADWKLGFLGPVLYPVNQTGLNLTILFIELVDLFVFKGGLIQIKGPGSVDLIDPDGFVCGPRVMMMLQVLVHVGLQLVL